MTKFKHILCLALSLTISFGHTSCSNNDEDDNGLGYYQTNEDKKLEKELMNTKWKLSKLVAYDNDDQIEEIDDFPFKGAVINLTSQKDTETYTDYDYVCIVTKKDGSTLNLGWAVIQDKTILIMDKLGKLISYTGTELIISNHKQDVLGYYTPEGTTLYFTKIVDQN